MALLESPDTMTIKNNHPLAHMSDETRTKLLMIALWQLAGEKSVTVTSNQVHAFNEAFTGMPTLMIRGHGENTIEISITTVGKATLEASVMNQGGR